MNLLYEILKRGSEKVIWIKILINCLSEVVKWFPKDVFCLPKLKIWVSEQKKCLSELLKLLTKGLKTFKIDKNMA